MQDFVHSKNSAATNAVYNNIYGCRWKGRCGTSFWSFRQHLMSLRGKGHVKVGGKHWQLAKIGYRCLYRCKWWPLPLTSHQSMTFPKTFVHKVMALWYQNEGLHTNSNSQPAWKKPEMWSLAKNICQTLWGCKMLEENDNRYEPKARHHILQRCWNCLRGSNNTWKNIS